MKKKQIILPVRMSPTLYRHIRRCAKTFRATKSGFICLIIENWVIDDDAKAAEKQKRNLVENRA